MTTRLTQLQELQEKLNRDLTNASLFAEVIREAIQLAVDEKDLAKALSTSRTTINRWKNGNSTPHPIVLGIISKELKLRVNTRIKLEKNNMAGGSSSGYEDVADDQI